jgi:hypothetical protein
MIFAHQGGWDEMLFVIVPLAVVFGLIVLVKRRANQSHTEQSDPLDQRPE